MEKAHEIYDYYLSIGDERVENWFLMDTPVKTGVVLCLYLFSIFAIKKIMSKREAFELKGFLYVYNAFQVLASLYITLEIIIVAIQSKYSLVCEPVDYSTNPLPMRMASVLWFYYFIKLVDLIDTIIFALRKKSNQITFLHVFHHFSMVANGWFGIKYVAGGQTFFLAMLNSFVHVIMYSYYGLSALGPEFQNKWLWWKKYLTQLQLFQFFLIMVHAIVNLCSDCPYPKGFSIAFIVYGIYITVLFLNFYKQSYKTGKSEKKPKQKKAQ